MKKNKQSKKKDYLKLLFSILNILIAMYLLKKNKYIFLCLYSLSLYLMLVTVKGKELRIIGKIAKKEIQSVVWPKKKRNNKDNKRSFINYIYNKYYNMDIRYFN